MNRFNDKPMKLIPIIVECHSGYKSGEFPIAFSWMNIRYEIKEISDRWFQAQSNPGTPKANYFKVRTAEKSIFIIKHNLESDQWFLVTSDNQGFGFSSN